MAHRQNKRMPVSRLGSSSAYASALRRCPWATATSSRTPAWKRASEPCGDSSASSTPWRANRSRGNQQAPRLRSSQKSLMMLVSCSASAKEVDSSCVALRGDRGRVAAEQLREHLADHPRHVVAIAVEIARARETRDARRLLKMM